MDLGHRSRLNTIPHTSSSGTQPLAFPRQHRCRPCKGIERRLLTTQEKPACARALLQQDAAASSDETPVAASRSTDSVQQLVEQVSDADGYLPLSEAQEIITEVVGADQPSPPKFLSFCKSGEEVSITLNR